MDVDERAARREDAHVRRIGCALAAVCAVSVTLGVTEPALGQATPCADLQITGIAFTPDTPVQSRPADIAITVRNGGTCAAGGFVVQFRTSLFAPTGPSRALDGLAPGASTTLHLSFAFPQ